MNSIRIENLRCFTDTGDIELLPLNIAVGRNSCGKSSILRTFPLFKQTIEAKTSEPILWYGRYVDFGDFNQSLTKLSNEKEITFHFNFDTNFKNIKDVNISLILKVRQKYISFLEINLLDNNIKISFLENGEVSELIINNEDFDVTHDKTKQIDVGIIPKISNSKHTNKYLYGDFFLFDDTEKIYMNSKLKENLDEIIDKDIKNRDIFIQYIYKYFVKKLPTKEDIDKNITEIIKRANKSRQVLLDMPLNFEKEFIPQTFREDVENMTKHEIDKIKNKIKDKYSLIYNNALSENLNEIIEVCNSYLFYYFNNTSYIAPVRAMAERYYRIQGLAIDDVDSRGENIPMILQNMNKVEKEKFINWMLEKFGFFVTTISTEGHISLIINNNGKQINIADTGFGYSQILPIIILLWKYRNHKSTIRYRKMNKLHKLIIIEQPELHLHPKMQAQLIDVIIEIINETDTINFLIETHSQTIIDYIGSKIEYKKINEEKINVLLVEQYDNQLSKINNVKYSREGYLQEWPMDFFIGDEW